MYSIARIVWLDAQGEDGWKSLQEVKDGPHLAQIDSVGFVIREDDTSITLALAIDTTNENSGAYMTIPKSCIQLRTKVE